MRCVRQCAVCSGSLSGEKNQAESALGRKGTGQVGTGSILAPVYFDWLCDFRPITPLSGPGPYCNPRALYLYKSLSALKFFH